MATPVKSTTPVDHVTKSAKRLAQIAINGTKSVNKILINTPQPIASEQPVHIEPLEPTVTEQIEQTDTPEQTDAPETTGVYLLSGSQEGGSSFHQNHNHWFGFLLALLFPVFYLIVGVIWNIKTHY
eukprot:767379_1